MAHFNERNDPITVVLADLDELKWVNDKYGHQMGDKLVCETAVCFEAYADNDMLIARIGGDEFSILIPNKSVLQVEQYLKNVEMKMQKTIKICRSHRLKYLSDMNIATPHTALWSSCLAKQMRRCIKIRSKESY